MGRLLALIFAGLAVSGPVAAGAAEFRLLEMDGAALKWGVPAFGAGAAVTYGFATAAQDFPDAINCRSLAPLAALAPAWGGDPARLERLVAGAFALWSRAADLAFRPARPGEAPDILIGAEGVPLKVAFANVWHGPAADGIAPLTRATICLNPEADWRSGAGPLPAGELDLGTVLAHEIGHAIGLDHPGATGALMGYSNQGSMERLMPGDVAGAVALYGPAKD